MEEITIQEYDIGDREECISLLESVFPNTSDEATFKWRFEAPDREKPLLICAKTKNKVVSFNSWIPWEFTYKNKRYLGYQSGESATDINLRGQGIFSKIQNFALDIAIQKNIDFFFGFPDSMSYGAALRFGYYPVATYYFCIRPLNPFNNKIRYKEHSNKYINYPSMMLIEHAKITPIVNDEYCKWRYENNPKHYDIIEFVEDNSRAVFYLRSKMWKHMSEMILLDCQFSNYNEIFLEHAFKYLFSLYARKAFYIRTFFNKNSERGRFMNSYFPIRVKSRNCKFMVKNISGRIDLKEILNLNQWEIMPHCVDDL